jgi:hypothetical protein
LRLFASHRGGEPTQAAAQEQKPFQEKQSMTDLPRIKAGGLHAAIDAQISDLLRMRIPSLRYIHSSKRSLIDVDFDLMRDDPLRLTAPHGRTVQRSHRQFAGEWIDMIQSVLAPGQLTGLKARVKSSREPVIEQTPGYLSATTLAVSTWPARLPWPQGVELRAVMKAHASNENGDPGIDVALEILGQSEVRQLLHDSEQTIGEAIQELGYFWGRCCQEIAPWLQDGGISELEILVPVMPSDMSPDSMAVPGGVTVH